MGLSIFYSLSLPRTLAASQVEERLALLAEKIKEIAKDKKIKVGISKIRILSAADCAIAQAQMSEDFDFSRSACRPPGTRNSSPLGEVPELAMYFRMAVNTQVGIKIGVAKYADGADFKMIGADSVNETPYDRRWYFWTFIDAFSNDEAAPLEAAMQEAKDLGFETTFKSEGDLESEPPRIVE
jgi:hypothetical protein